MGVMIDPRKADAAYRPFPPFAAWAACRVDDTRWQRYVDRLRKRGEASPEHLKRAVEVAKRAAAIDTGAIEGLYDVDRGFTLTVATQTAMWETLLDAKGAKVRSLIEAQLRAYDLVLDLATQSVPVAESWIRALHAEICREQSTYLVYTEIGPQEQDLPLGEYKKHPNHVRTPSGEIHSYAPVDMTPAEMHRLCEQLRAPDFLEAHPVLQASYAHYALVAVHPFADGNGRVARALASVYTYRARSFPFLVLVEDKPAYYDSLRAADGGNFQSFVDFVFDRAVDAIRLIDEALGAAGAPRPDEALAGLRRLFTTKGGFPHEHVDAAAKVLIEAFERELSARAKEATAGGELKFNTTWVQGDNAPSSGEYRHPVKTPPGRVQFSLSSPEPAPATVARFFGLQVPRDCGRDDELMIRERDGTLTFEARVDELVPRLSTGLQLRLRMFTERVLGETIDMLNKKAASALKQRGY